VIEDSGAGVIAGKSAGMKVIAIPNKYTKHQDFAKADKIVNSLSEITMSVLESLGQ
jgi:beta-phosphoglucomutase-like phosphatase (HAD superfamily)